MTQDGSPNHRNAGNNPHKIQKHNQSENPRHQHKPKEKSHRSTQHQRQRDPEKQGGEGRRRHVLKRQTIPSPPRRELIGEVG